ncbi:MAG: capsular exopolysaccharide synthesis family protein [Candidatus Poriferisodalaceae bacterium]|jgi:capsular exopolysaccharide synthesis family protein
MTKEYSQMAKDSSPYLGGIAASEHGSSELDLRRVARVLRRWTLLILIIALDLAALMFWFESSKTPYYESVAVVELNEIARNVSENVVSNNEERANAVVTLGSNDLAQRARTELGYPTGGVIKTLAEEREGTAAVQVRGRANSPEQAQIFLTTALDIYRSDRVADVTAPKIDALNGLFADKEALELQLTEDEEEVERLTRDPAASQSSIDTAGERRSQTVRDLSEVESEIRTLERDVATSTGDMDLLTEPNLDPLELGRSPVRGAMLGFIGGLILGTIIVLAVTAIRDRVALSTDVEAIAGSLPILASIPRFDRKIEAQGGPIINIPGAKREAEAFRFLAASMDLVTANERPTTVAITSSGKSDGKTTTSVNLALAMGRDGHTVALVDGDVYRIGTSRALGVKATVSTIDVLTGANHADDAIVGYRSGDVAINLMPGRPMGNVGPSPMTMDRLRPMLDSLRSSHDLVFVDSPPVLAVSDAIVAASACELTLVVVRLGHTRRRDLRRTLAALHQAGARVAGLVVTHTKDRADTYYDY